MVTDDVFSQMAVHKTVADRLRIAAHAARQGDTGSAMTHAWLFTGPPGSGRSVAAVAFAAALECEDPDIIGCGHCRQCEAVRQGSHGDVVHEVPRGLSISVDTVRTRIIEPAVMRPAVGRWRVVILDNADRLTDSAANALLKTVEEPPAHTVIMLCTPSTDPSDIMPTLYSRSRHLYVPQPSTAEVTAILMRDPAVSEQAAALAAAATGQHIGRARRLVHDSAAQQRRVNVLHLAEDIEHGSTAFFAVSRIYKEIVSAAEADLNTENEHEQEQLRTALGMGAKGKGAQRALRGANAELKQLENEQKRRKQRAIRDAIDLALVDLAGFYRDALLQAGGDEAQVALTHPDMQPHTADLAKRLSLSALVGCLDAIMHTRQALDLNVSPETALDGMIGRLRLAYSR
ncbi:MAG: DNA polymerase III subunit delta' [Corynebacterium sp.]|nr:DNA polymerase III subunit delta' [Corynebacterium sp.]